MNRKAKESSTDTSRIYLTRRQLLDLRYEKNESLNSRSRHVNSPLHGDLLSLLKGQGIEFTDIRPYQPGDEIRHIDWRTTARAGTPYTRQYNEEREQSVYLAIDQRINMFFGSASEFKSYTCARLAGLLIWGSVAKGYRLGGTVAGVDADADSDANTDKTTTTADNADADYSSHNASSRKASSRNAVASINTAQSDFNVTGRNTGSVRSGPSRKTALKLIHNITVANNALNASCPAAASASASLDELLNQALVHSKTGTIVFLISDFYGFNANSKLTLHALARRCKVVMIMISDGIENDMPAAGTVGISDGLSHRKLALSSDHRKQYQRLRQEFVQQIQHCAQSIGGHLAHCYTSTVDNTDQPFQHPLQQRTQSRTQQIDKYPNHQKAPAGRRNL